jgi:predicted metal-dependent hydrolase
MTDYTMIRTNRKTLAIHIRDGSVEVRAPLRISEAEIDNFVVSNEKWIQKKLAEAKSLQQQRSDFSLSYGDKIALFGQDYPIVGRSSDRIGFDGQQFLLPSGLEAEEIRQACIQIYRMSAKSELTEKAVSFGDSMHVMPTAVKINGSKTRWGSCSTKHSLNFSWRLMMAPEDVVDYVVVHELAHIKEMNHSTRFWSVVADVVPDYRLCVVQLRQLQKRLSSENWD